MLQVDSLPSEPQGKPKNTGVGSLSLLQRIFPTQESNRGLLHWRCILYQLSYREAQWQVPICSWHSSWHSRTRPKWPCPFSNKILNCFSETNKQTNKQKTASYSGESYAEEKILTLNNIWNQSFFPCSMEPKNRDMTRTLTPEPFQKQSSHCPGRYSVNMLFYLVLL